MQKHRPATSGRQFDRMESAQALEFGFWSLSYLINKIEVVYIRAWHRIDI